MQKFFRLLRYYYVLIFFIFEQGGPLLAAKFGSKAKHSFPQYGKALKYKITFGFFYDTVQYLP
jgi:hypothetical protein